MNRRRTRLTRTRLLATGLVLTVIAASIGWALYVRERQKTGMLAAQISSHEEEAAKVRRANGDMRVIEVAYKKSYGEHGQWPENIQQIAPQLGSDQAGLKDPWGRPYAVRIEVLTQIDGQTVERPVV